MYPSNGSHYNPCLDFVRKHSEAFGRDRKNGNSTLCARKEAQACMGKDIEFKAFADILKTNISPEIGDGSFLATMIDAYLRKPTDADLQNLRDEAEEKSKKRRKKVEPEPWNPFSGLEEDTLERIYRGTNPWDPRKLAKVKGRRSDTRFADWINQQDKIVVTHIEDDFKSLCPGFSDENMIGFACQDWFADFIQKQCDRNRPNLSPLSTPTASATGKMTAEEFQKSFRVGLENGKIYYGSQIISIPPELQPPDTIKDEEDLYISALLDAYAQAVGVKMYTKNDICLLKRKHRENFEEQRINYYAAIRITRIIRECFLNSEEELKRWLDESSDYISDTRRDDYKDGFERLKAVLKMVINCKTTSAVDQCGRLIGPKERKGACHLLTNEGRFVWVNENDE